MEMKGSRKLKIAIIHPDVGIGGGERLIVDAAVELAAHGHCVHVFTAHHDRNCYFEETVADNIILSFPDLLLAQHTTVLRKMYRKPIDMFEEITTVIVTPRFPYGSRDLSRDPGITGVNSYRARWGSPLRRFTASTFAKTFSKLHSRGVRPAILYPAVNLDQFDKPYAYKLNFLSINQFERKKNLQLAISALHRPVCLPHHDYLSANSGQCPVVPSSADLTQFPLSSQDEHYGHCLPEAMAAQKPMIACNSGGPVKTIIHEVTGYLCDPTPLDFSKSMAKLMADPEMAINMGKEACRHVTEKISMTIFGEQLNRYVLDTCHQRTV